jgi:hypothetical protein
LIEHGRNIGGVLLNPMRDESRGIETATHAQTPLIHLPL